LTLVQIELIGETSKSMLFCFKVANI